MSHLLFKEIIRTRAQNEVTNKQANEQTETTLARTPSIHKICLHTYQVPYANHVYFGHVDRKLAVLCRHICQPADKPRNLPGDLLIKLDIIN